MDKNLIRALKYLKPYLGLAILTVILSFLLSAANAAPVWFIQYLIDEVLEKKDYKMLYIIAGSMIGVSIVKGFSLYSRQYFSSYIANHIIHDIREKLFFKIQKLSLGFYKKMEVGQLISRFTNDAQKFQSAINNLFKGIPKLMTITILMAKVFFIDWKLATISIVFLPIISTIIKKFSKKLKSRGKKIQEEIGTITSYLSEIISGVYIVKAFSAENYEKGRFQKENKANLSAILRSQRVRSRVSPVVDFFNTIIIVIIMIYGGRQVIEGKISSGELFAFLTALGLMYEPIKSLVNINNEVQTSTASIDRIMEVIDMQPDIVEKKDAISDFDVSGNVTFENINFRYEKDGNEILKNINLNVKKGEIIALVGQSGSGKTTLVNLIPRFYDVDSGSIKFDETDIRDLKINTLRQSIAIVPQDNFLFSGTISENISYGSNDTSIEEIENAAKMANAYDFIMSFANGFDTEVGERGTLLSGGQKQRLAIARALLRNPKILILDEATSALDTESERLVQDALDKLMQNRTTFVIAHRLSTIFHADKILVMKNGEIIESGRHEELLEKGGAYKTLYDTQFHK